MAYTLCTSFNVGTAALTLKMALTNSDGTPHATVRDVAVTEIGQGYYQCTSAAIPDSYRGTPIAYVGTLGAATDFTGVTIWASSSINPQETEFSDVKTSSITSSTPPTAIEIAEEVLKIDWTTVSGEASRSVLNALRFIRNGFSIAGTTLSVLGEDDTTVKYTRDLAVDASAQPIVGVS